MSKRKQELQENLEDDAAWESFMAKPGMKGAGSTLTARAGAALPRRRWGVGLGAGGR